MDTEKKIKIGIDARFLLRPMRGMSLYVNRLCQLLPIYAKDINFIYFINQKFEHNDLKNNYLPILHDLKNNSNVKIVNIDDDAEILWEQVYLPKALTKHKVDLIHMPTNRSCFIKKIPIVSTIHDVMEYNFLKTNCYNFLFKDFELKFSIYKCRTLLYSFMMYKFLFNKNKGIITVSNNSSKDILRITNYDINKIKVIYHGLDIDFFISEEKIKPFSQRKYILMLGGDNYYKNPEGSIKAWERLPNELKNKYPLKIIGFCGDTNSRLIDTLKKLDLLGTVEIEGWVDRKKLIEYFRNAVLFLYLSRYEGFGLPIIQSMASGTPVISSNTSSIPEILGKNIIGHDPEDHKKTSNYIELLLKDENIWRKQSEAGICRSKDFVWENSINEHIKFYKKIIRNQ